MNLAQILGQDSRIDADIAQAISAGLHLFAEQRSGWAVLRDIPHPERGEPVVTVREWSPAKQRHEERYVGPMRFAQHQHSRSGRHEQAARVMADLSCVSVEVEMRRAWWLDVYLQGVLFMVLITGGEPDMEKVMRVVVRGMRWRFKGARTWQRF